MPKSSKLVSSVPSGGSIACNPGQKDTVKLSPQRAVFESISNALNAVTADKTGAVCVAEFFPKCAHPLALTSDYPSICCKTLSNSYLDPTNYGSAINMGRTRDTEQGTDKQTVGNDMGIGMKESAFSLGGSLGFISVDMTNEKSVKVSGFIVDDQVMELRALQGITQQKELSYATFEAVAKFNDGKAKVTIVYPMKPTEQSEMNDMMSLFCTGLPFCKEGTHFKYTGIDDVLESCSNNRSRFMEFVVKHATECLAWKSRSTSWLKSDPDISSRFSEDALAECMNKCSTWYCHSMAADVFKQATDGNPGDMDDSLKSMVPCHKWCVTGDRYPLSYSIAREINYPYYDRRNNAAIVMLEGIDVRKANVYIPLVRMDERIRERQGTASNAIADAVIKGKEHELAKVSFCNVWQGNRPVNAAMNDTSLTYSAGIPFIEWEEEGQEGPVQIWPDWDIAATRDPPLGTVVVRGPTVINKDDPVDFWLNMGNYVDDKSEVPKLLRQSYNKVIWKLDDERGRDQGLLYLKHYCNAMRIPIRTKDRTFVAASVIEKKLEKQMDVMHPAIPGFEYQRIVTAPFLECMLMTKTQNDTKQFFPDGIASHPSRNYMQRVFGVTSCSILDLNTNLFTVNVEKTKVAPIDDSVPIDMLGCGYFAASSVFGMNYGIPKVHADKIEFINCNKQLFTNKFLPSHIVEANEAEQQKRRQEALRNKENLKDHTDTPLSQWVHMYKQFIMAEENAQGASRLRYEKNADQRGWAVEVRFRSGPAAKQPLDLYFDHFVHRTKFKAKTLRTIESVLWFDKWFSDGCPLDNPSDTEKATKWLDTKYVRSLEQKNAEQQQTSGGVADEQPQQESADSTPATVEADAAAVVTDIDGDAEMTDPMWAQRRRGVAASTAVPSSSPASRDSVFKTDPHRSEQYAKMWYDKHDDKDPLFVWKIGREQIEVKGRLKHYMAMDAKLQDNEHLKDTDTPIFTWNEVADMARVLVNFTDTKDGKRRMLYVNKKAKTGKRQKTEASCSTDRLPESMIEEVD